MTERLDFDRFVSDWLHDAAPAKASERALTDLLERVAVVDQDRGLYGRWFGESAGRPTWVRRGLLSALLVIGLLGAFAVGSALLRRQALPGDRPANGAIAFSSAGDIYVASVGREPQRVIGQDGDGIDQTCPVFSPDGASLAYIETPSLTQDGDPWDVVVTGRTASGEAGGAALRMPTAAIPGDCARWAPDGRRLAYLVDGALMELTVIGLDGATTVAFRRDDSGPGESGFGGLQDASFAWSPNGSAIALVIGYWPGASEVWIVPVDGGKARRVLVGATDAEIFSSVAWAPDGSRIMVWGHSEAASADGETAVPRDYFLRSLPVDGATPPNEIDRWTEQEVPSSGAAWSPDGSRIGYVRNGEIVVAAPDGTASRHLPPIDVDGTWWPGELTWSPDGSRLLSFGADQTFFDRGVRSRLVSVDPEGASEPIVLTPWGLGLKGDHAQEWQPVFASPQAWWSGAQGVVDRGTMPGRTPDPRATPTPPPAPATAP